VPIVVAAKTAMVEGLEAGARAGVQQGNALTVGLAKGAIESTPVVVAARAIGEEGLKAGVTAGAKRAYDQSIYAPLVNAGGFGPRTVQNTAFLLSGNEALAKESVENQVGGAMDVVETVGTTIGTVQAARGLAVVAKKGVGSFLNSRDVARIAEIRSSLNVGKKRNIAYGEGHIDGKDFGEVLGVSGQTTPGSMLRGERIFETGVDGHDRALDAEVFVLESYARRLTPSSKGTLTLVSERALCESCTSVVDQFQEMFPNVNLVIRAGTGG